MGSGSAHAEGRAMGIKENRVIDFLGHDEGHSFRSNVAGLASNANMTGIRDEILLVSWLIVLLRTREDGHICFEWTYKDRGNESVIGRLSTDEVMAGLQNKIGHVATAISRHITALVPGDAAISSPVKLLLSTGSLSKAPEAVNQGVSTLPGPIAYQH